MEYDLTEGSITGKLLRYAFPLILGNLLQQLYNVADTLIVGRYLGEDALAAVGSSYTLMVFLTSILIGLCMGSSAFFAIQFGRQDRERMKNGIFLSFILIAFVTVLLNVLVFAGLHWLIYWLRIPDQIAAMTRDYLLIVFAGIFAVFLYNFFANLLRSVGNSMVPLIFLAVSAVGNILLDLFFVLVLEWGVKGAAVATVLSQYVSGIGIMLYCFFAFPELSPQKRHLRWNSSIVKEITGLSFLTCIQQSIMNFGILAVQSLVNRFGTTVMAAFAAAVKIDTFAYMPVQDFGNAFSVFVAQNYGAGKYDRIRKGMKSAVSTVAVFCCCISLLVCIFARFLMGIFAENAEAGMIGVGMDYLRIEGAFYIGIGLLFLFYGFYRAVKRPGMSVVLTVISLGSRVALAYCLSGISWIGVTGIWAAVPIGWILADSVGAFCYRKWYRKQYISAKKE